jgi:toxin secretion/phage lysis holin
MKAMLCTTVGLIGGIIATAFGGWDQSLTTLFIFMVIDYVTGLIVAGVFKRSGKSQTGALDSSAGWKGICKKGVSLLIVLVAARIDITLNIGFCRTTVVIAFIANELISITENAGLMGIPIPSVIVRSIDILKKQSEKEGEQSE